MKKTISNKQKNLASLTPVRAMCFSLIVLIAVVNSLSANAGHYNKGKHHKRGHAEIVTSAKVIQVEPIYKDVVIKIPKRIKHKKAQVTLRARHDHYYELSYHPKRKKVVTKVIQKLDGYAVTYRYLGELFTTRMRNHPGRKIPIRINIEPV